MLANEARRQELKWDKWADGFICGLLVSLGVFLYLVLII